MTAPPAAMCGHRWTGLPLCIRPDTVSLRSAGADHRCVEPADHTRHRCGCGATTTRET